MKRLERKAMVIGATGLVGELLVHSLLEHPAYSLVRVLVRRPLEPQHPKLEQHVVDWEQLESQDHLFDGIDDLYCCLGTTIKKAGSQDNFRQVDYHYPVRAATIAKQHGVSQMLVISSMGASADSRVFYSRTKGEMEDALSDIGFPSLHIFRPSLILGDRNEKRFGEQMVRLCHEVSGSLDERQSGQIPGGPRRNYCTGHDQYCAGASQGKPCVFK